MVAESVCFNSYARGALSFPNRSFRSNHISAAVLAYFTLLLISFSIAVVNHPFIMASQRNHGMVTHADMKKIFGEMALGLMLRIILGWGGEDTRDTTDAGEGEKLRDKVKEFFRMLGELTVSDVVPFLKWLDYFGGTNEEAFKKTGMEMDRMLQVWLEDRKTRNHKTNDGFMSEMMVAADEVAEEFPEYDADTITKATCQTMILGGTDTTTVTLTWALSLLLNNRHTIERAQHELDAHVGRQRQVKASDVENLVYIQSIIKETYPPAPLLPLRESTDDFTVAGYRIKPGTRLIVNIWKLQRDPRVWNSGPRDFLRAIKILICPGITFALQLTAHALATLLHGFDIETVSDEAVDMTGSLGATNIKSTPLEVLLTPRLLPGAYA
ncbi:hypothetical protein OROMI_033662 [Orobanche minor]